jgi:hypothetical protein
VQHLLPTYGFRGAVEPMVGLAVQRREFGDPSPLTIMLTVVRLRVAIAAAPAHPSYQLLAALRCTKPWRRLTLLPTITTRDLISIREMVT